MSDNESENEEVADLSSPDVTTKYRTASEITNKALQKVLEACVDGADIATLCEMGDGVLLEETGKLYNKKPKGSGDSKDPKAKEKKIEKGIAFPTCISVNELVGHFSPFKGESCALKKGDLVKVDLACHIDGFIAAAAHSIVVGGDKVDDRRADVVSAAWNAAEAALRLVQVGNKNTQITDVFSKVGAEFLCKPVQGVKSHQLKKHVIDGSQCILNVETQEDKNEEFEFEQNEVYCIDVVMSTGEGKTRESGDHKSTVFKRAVETSYNLKTQKARQFISEVNRRFPALPFTLRAIEEEQVARIGVSEARRHELLEEYHVLKEKPNEFVAQFKFTVLLLPGGTKKVTGLDFQKDLFNSSCEIKDEGLKQLLASSANPKKKKKKAAKGDKEEDEKKEP